MNNMNKEKKVKKTKLSILRLMFFLLISIFLIRVIFSIFNGHVKTEIVKIGNLELADDATGYIIKNEKIIQSPASGKIQKLVSEGTRVKCGVDLLSIQKSDSLNQYSQKVDQINKQITEINNNSTNLLFQNDISTIDSKISQNLEKVSDISKNGDINELSKTKSDIQYLLDKKSKIVGNQSFSAQNIEDKNKQKLAYTEIVNSSKVEVPTSVSGIVSYNFDGYEQLLSTQNIPKITSEDLNKISINDSKTTSINKNTNKNANNSNEVSVGQPVVKIIDNYEWYIVTSIKKEQISPLKVKDEVSLIINNLELDATVYNISNEKNGESVIAFRLTSNLEKFYDKRKIDIKIVKRNFQGILIPTSSLVINGDKRGVFVINNGIAKFTETDIEGFNEKYAIVYSNNELSNRKGLSLNDIIITNPKRVVDGQIIKY